MKIDCRRRLCFLHRFKFHENFNHIIWDISHFIDSFAFEISTLLQVIVLSLCNIVRLDAIDVRLRFMRSRLSFSGISSFREYKILGISLDPVCGVIPSWRSWSSLEDGSTWSNFKNSSAWPIDSVFFSYWILVKHGHRSINFHNYSLRILGRFRDNIWIFNLLKDGRP